MKTGCELSVDCVLQRLGSGEDSQRHQPSTSVLEVAAITRDQAGVYTCHATNDAGNATFDVNVVVECKHIFSVAHLRDLEEISQSFCCSSLLLQQQWLLYLDVQNFKSCNTRNID